MAVKANWQNGEQFNASDANAVADAVNASYVKPSGGIPATDFTSGVQLSLGKADTAVQAVASTTISDATTVGKSLLTAADASAARTAIGVAYGSTAGTVVQGNDSRLSPSSTSISDATTVGKALLTATDAASGRSTLGVSYGTSAATVCQGNDSRVTGAEQTSNKGAANGYAGLDSSGKVALSSLATSTSAAVGVGSVELGHASDTTLTRSSAGKLAVEGKDVVLTDDSRLSDARTPTAAGQVADVSVVAFGANTVRASSSYGDFPFGVKLQRAVTFSSVTFRVATADASGNLVVELRKNGSQVSGTSTTIAAASQVAGGTSTGTWAFSSGDILTAYVTGVGTTPGKGLVADIKGLTA